MIPSYRLWHLFDELVCVSTIDLKKGRDLDVVLGGDALVDLANVHDELHGQQMILIQQSAVVLLWRCRLVMKGE